MFLVNIMTEGLSLAANLGISTCLTIQQKKGESEVAIRKPSVVQNVRNLSL